MRLSYFEGASCFGSASFHSKVDGYIKRFHESLPNKIEFVDDSKTVEFKIGEKPVGSIVHSHGGSTDEYQIAPNLLMAFGFKKSGEELILISVRYVPAWDMENGRPKLK